MSGSVVGIDFGRLVVVFVARSMGVSAPQFERGKFPKTYRLTLGFTGTRVSAPISNSKYPWNALLQATGS